MRMKSKLGLLCGALLGLATAGAATAQQVTEISGAGATFPYPIYAKWAAAYNQQTGVKLNYQSIGSGGGIKQIKAGTVDFGASDKPLKPEELKQAGLMQFPMIMGGVVPVVNIEGVKPGQLKLTPQQLADIFLGKITKWNDPALAQNNPGLKLPDRKITVVHRSDGSGTTWIFTNYLSKVSKEWADKVGNESAVKWPIGIGGKGNEGVAAYVDRVNGGIGYVEFAYALENKIPHAQLQNQAGNYVEPSIETFQAAASGADWKNADSFYVVLTNQPGAQSWPITGASFILMHKQQKDPQRAQAVLKFFDWAYRNGDQLAIQLHYVPMPNTVGQIVEQAWAEQIHGPNGQPIWTPEMGAGK
jgi:phosphate transport system substrate-binding protein